MEPTPKKPGRPRVWPTRISAPPLALELYALIGRIQDDPTAFATCHPYDGASITPVTSAIPGIKYQGQIRGLPFVVASYLAIPTSSQRLCPTPNCANPLHYSPSAPEDIRLLSAKFEFPAPPLAQFALPTSAPAPQLREWWELIDYELDQHEVPPSTPRTFDLIRPLIHPDDLSDADLTLALANPSFPGE